MMMITQQFNGVDANYNSENASKQNDGENATTRQYDGETATVRW